jgi:hypothetical protein
MLTEIQVGESGIPKGSKEKVIMHFLELTGRHNWVPPRVGETTSTTTLTTKQLPPRADETTSARQQEDSDGSNDYENTDSDDTDSSIQFELERIVSGPCKRAQIKVST